MMLHYQTVKSKAFQVRTGSPSLRATIPEAVVQVLDIAHGDELEWIITTQEGEIIVLLRKAE